MAVVPSSQSYVLKLLDCDKRILINIRRRLGLTISVLTDFDFFFFAQPFNIKRGVQFSLRSISEHAVCRNCEISDFCILHCTLCHN